MNRRSLTVAAFSICAVGVLFLSSFAGSQIKPAHAQDDDLVVIQNPRGIEFDDDFREAQATYLELTKQKLQLLTPEELARETANLRRELTELQTNRALMQVEKQLERIINENPDSTAANRARLMLEAGQRAGLREPITLDPNVRSRRTNDYNPRRPDTETEELFRPRRRTQEGE